MNILRQQSGSQTRPIANRLSKNNFDLLRLIFAGVVCLVHSHVLSGFSQLKWILTFLSSSVAVNGFFVISGFLIFMSYERSQSIGNYFSKRMRRIYPAYFTIVMIQAVALFAISSKDFQEYFSYTWVKYVATNLLFANFLQQTLPGVFETNLEPTINGALWTLKIEVMFYLSVPIFVILFRKYSHLSVLAIAYCLSFVYSELFQAIAERTGSEFYLQIGRQLPGQLAYFMAGGFFYYFLPTFLARTYFFLLPAIIIILVNFVYPLPFLLPFSLATLVVFVGVFFYLGNVAKFGDFSYGVYILHVPIIQLLINSRMFNDSPWLFLLAVATLTVACSIALWHLVEKWFLLRSSHYVSLASVTTSVPSQGNVH